MEVAVSWAGGDEIGEDEIRKGLNDMPAPAQFTATGHDLEALLRLPLKQAESTFKRLYLTRVLEQCNWNNADAGKKIGYSREGVRSLRQKLGIEESDGMP
jgi:transcriptional regulator with GAF, ATPase, and Fis domain